MYKFESNHINFIILLQSSKQNKVKDNKFIVLGSIWIMARNPKLIINNKYTCIHI